MACCATASRQVKSVLGLALLIVLLTIPVVGQTESPMVELLSDAKMDVNPRDIITVGLSVTNNTSDKATYTITAETPPNWSFSADPASLELDPGKQDVSYGTLMMPSDLRAGTYHIVLDVAPSDKPANAVKRSVDITVAAFEKLQVSAKEKSFGRSVASGTTFVLHFEVTNIGNVAVDATLTANSRPVWSTVMTPASHEVSLKPYESEEVVVSVTVPETIDKPLNNQLSLSVKSKSGGTGRTSWGAISLTRIVPSQLAPKSLYREAEGSIATQDSWDDRNGFASALKIGDFVTDFDNGTRVTLGPFNAPLTEKNTSAFVQQKNLYGAYESRDNLSVYGGDVTYDLVSPLMGRYVVGRGGDFTITRDDSDFSVFYLKQRGSFSQSDAGVQYAYRIGDDGQIRLTGFREIDQTLSTVPGEDSVESRNFGLFTQYAPPNGSIKLEGELGFSDEVGGDNDTAYRLFASTRQDKFNGSAEWTHAGPGFHVGFKDLDQKIGSLWWNPFDGISVWSNYNQSRSNLLSDPERSAPRYRNLEEGVSWDLKDIGRLSASHRASRNVDLTLDANDEQRKTTQYSYYNKWGDFSMKVSYTDTNKTDFLTDDIETQKGFSADSTIRLGVGSTLRISIAPQKVTHSVKDLNFNTTNISIGGNFAISKDTTLSLDYDRYKDMETGNEHSSVYGNFRYNISKNHSLIIRARRFTGSGDSNTEVALEFQIPINIPLKMFPVRGSVQGRVYSVDNPDQGIPGVGIMVGDLEVLSDENGNFKFPGLDPGPYQLELDKNTLQLGVSPTGTLPIAFTVTKGKTTKLDIPVRKSASIGGTVYIEMPGEDGTASERVPRAGIRIELKGDSGMQTRTSDSEGNFLYTDLAAGHYTLSLPAEALGLTLEIVGPDSFEIDLAPSEDKKGIEFTIHEVAREMSVTTMGEEEQ